MSEDVTVRMVWNGKMLRTHRDHFDAFCLCQSDDSRKEFIRKARQISQHIPGNIQYMIGYCDQARAQDLWAKLRRAQIPA